MPTYEVNMATSAQSSRARNLIDRNIAASGEFQRARTPARGWIRTIRDALGMTQQQLAKRLGVNQKSVHAMEVAEAGGKIRLETLSRAADALGCDLVYVLVPRRPLQDVVEDRAREVAVRQLDAVDQTMLLEDQGTPRSDSRVEALLEGLIAQGSPLWRDEETEWPRSATDR